MKIPILKYYLTVIPLLFASTTLLGQNIRFDRIGLQEGLSQSGIIIQATFLWIGTYLQITSYNQKTFTNYRNEINNEQSLCNDFINAILEDHYHNMWFATRGGLAYLPTSDQSEVFMPLQLWTVQAMAYLGHL